MLTTKDAIESGRIPAKLIRSVIRATGRENLPDIARHGIDGGFAGFTYYSDTSKFFRRNRADIVEIVREMAEDFGQEPIAFVAGFNSLDDDTETRESIARCLYGGRLSDDDVIVENALAWFAGEEVARLIADD